MERRVIVKAELTPLDHRMFALAKARGQVKVTHGDRVRLAILIAWRPKDKRGVRTKKARVQFATGTRATIPLSEIDTDAVVIP
jgi:hypothetical protein